MEQMTAQEALDAAKGITFERAWAILEKRYEDDRRKREEEQRIAEKKRAEEEKKRAEEEKKRAEEEKKRAEEEKKRAEEQKIADEKWKAEMAEFKKNLEKAVGYVGNSIGELTEALFSGQLWKKFKKYGYEFSKQCPDCDIIENNRVIAEVDLWLEDGDFVMPVEVKTKLKQDDINRHLERIETIRGYMDRKGDKRKIVGAVAGGIIKEEVISYAHKKGLYVIMQSGESVVIVKQPKAFKAQVWEMTSTPPDTSSPR